jgi:hypothetical protein
LVQGRLDLFFLCLAALMALNLALFLWVAARYEYKAVEHVKRLVLPRSLQASSCSSAADQSACKACLRSWVWRSSSRQ